MIKLGKYKKAKEDNPGVIYTFSCEDCSEKYTGKTKLTAKTRVHKHRRKHLKSVVYNHTIENKHEFHFKKIKILDNKKSTI